MPYRVDWLIPDQVVIMIYWGEQTVDDLRNALIEGNRLGAVSPYENVHSISDNRRVSKTISLSNAMRISYSLQQKTLIGWAITIGNLDVLLTMIVRVSRTLLGIPIQMVNSMDEALAFLREAQPDLSWDALNQQVLDFDIDDKLSETDTPSLN